MLSTTTEQDSDDSVYKYRRKSRRQRVSSLSSDSDDSIVARPHRRKKCRVSSTSSGSDDSLFARPSRKKCKVLSESECESTATSDSEEERNLRRRHNRCPNRHTVSSDSEAPSVKGSPKATNAALPDLNSSDSDDGEKCIICFKSLRPPFAHPSNCSHHFHPNCLSTWTKTSNTCPIDRVKYTAILVVDQKGDLVSREGVTTPPPQDHNADLEPDDATFCEVCSQHDREHEMLLCDRCEAGYHLDCLTPPLREVPDGTWFCPRCTDLGNELTEEVNELMDDAAIILETRMRQRTALTSRRPRTRGAQRVFNIIHHQQQTTTDQPSTSSVTIRRRHTSSRRTRRSKSTRRPQSTRYKVELITVEDGTTLEVKVAVNTRTKSKRHSKRKSKKKCSKSSRKNDGPSTSRDTIFTGEGPSRALDLFGSRPQLDYFSGCEAEDELDEDGGRGGGVSAVSRGARPGVRNMASRKHIAAQILNARPRRQAPRIEVSRAPVDLVSSIIEQQEKWHSPGAKYESLGNGDIRVIMKERGSKIRQAGGSSGSSSGNAPSTSAQTSSSSGEPLRSAGSSGSAGGSRDAYSAPRSSSTASSRNDDDGSKTPSSSERVPPSKMTSLAELDKRGKDGNEGSSGVPEGESISDDPSHPSVCSESLIEKEKEENDDNKEENTPIQGTCSKLGQDIADCRSDSDKSDDCDKMQSADGSFHRATDDHEDQRVPEDLSVKKTSKDSDEKVGNDVMEERLGADEETNSEKENKGVECTSHGQQDDNEDDDRGKQETVRENYDVEADDEDSGSEQDVARTNDTQCSKEANIAATSELDVDSHDRSIQSNVCRQDHRQGKQEAGVEELKHDQLVECDVEESAFKNDNIISKFDDNLEGVDEGKIGSNDETPENGAVISGSNEEVIPDNMSISIPGISNESTVAINDLKNDSIRHEISDNVDDVDEKKEVEASIIQDDEDRREDGSRIQVGKEPPDANASDYESNTPERLAVSVPGVGDDDSPEEGGSEDDDSRVRVGKEPPDANTSHYEFNAPERFSVSLPGVGDDDDTPEEGGSLVAASPSGKSQLKGDGHTQEEQTVDSEEDPDGSWPSNSCCTEPCSKDDAGGDDYKGHQSVYSDENQDTKLECETVDSKVDITESQQSTEEMKSSAKVSVSENEQEAESEPAGDLLEMGCEEDKDGLVDITDEEISSYERSWEMEENCDKKKTEGLEGLETEAISDCEYHLVEADVSQKDEDIDENQDIQLSTRVAEEASREEEGEIVTEEGSPVPKKKLPKERNYRGDVNKDKNKGAMQNDKQPDDRHDSRRVVAEKPRKKSDLVRDVSSDSSSTSLSSSIGRSISREKTSPSRTRSRSRSRVKERPRDRARERSKERSKSRSRERMKDRSLSREKNRRNRSRDKQSRSRKRQRTRTPRRERGRSRDRGNRDRKKRKRSPSSSCSSCSCSSCEREKKRNEKVTSKVPREGTGRDRSRNRLKNKKDQRRSGSRNRKRKTPVPSKEVFTSGNNILVSVNFKSSNAEEAGRTEGAPPSKRKKENEIRKKKDKRTKENQTMRSAVSKKSPKRRKINTSNMKPVAIIDLDASPFRETTLSPKEVIILSDSDDEEKMAKAPSSLLVSGPKTPPEPHIKFSIANSMKQQQQLRGIQNPLADKTGREGDDMMHIGPNTPPEPSVPYDPFEPTKSRSQSPGPTSLSDRIPSPAQEPKHHSPFQSQSSLTPPKLSQHDSPKTPSPLQCAPKDMDNILDKNKQMQFQPAGMDSGDDSPGGGGDSPYSPGSSEGDDLFEPPMATKPRQRPMATQSNKPKVQPPKVAMNAQKHSNHFTKDPSKKGPVKKDMSMKLDDDQWKILDDLPNSAVEMQVKDKFLKKLNRQERVVEEVKLVLKPHYAKKHVTKEEYKEILRRSVPKICHSRSGEINPMKIQRLIEAYVKKYRHKMKRKGVAPAIPPLRQNKPVVIKTQWA